MAHYTIGFDLGGTKMLAALFDKKLNKIAQLKRRTRPNSEGSINSKDGLDRIAELIEDLLQEKGVKHGDLAGIGIGAPGPVDMEKGVLEEAGNLGWKNVPLRKFLKKRFGCPVSAGNDVDLGVYGEYLAGAGKDSKVLLGAFPGTGLGGGLVVRGEIYVGARLSCMELGHVQVMPSGPRCGCGETGCLETMTSRLAISRDCAVEVIRGNAPTLDAISGSEISKMKSGALAASAAKDEAVERIILRAAKWLGIGLAGAVNLLGPDKIVLGGGMVEAMPKLILDEVRETVNRNAMKPYRDSFDVVAAKLGDDAVITGAAGLVQASRS